MQKQNFHLIFGLVFLLQTNLTASKFCIELSCMSNHFNVSHEITFCRPTSRFTMNCFTWYFFCHTKAQKRAPYLQACSNGSPLIRDALAPQIASQGARRVVGNGKPVGQQHIGCQVHHCANRSLNSSTNALSRGDRVSMLCAFVYQHTHRAEV